MSLTLEHDDTTQDVLKVLQDELDEDSDCCVAGDAAEIGRNQLRARTAPPALAAINSSPFQVEKKALDSLEVQGTASAVSDDWPVTSASVVGSSYVVGSNSVTTPSSSSGMGTLGMGSRVGSIGQQLGGPDAPTTAASLIGAMSGNVLTGEGEEADAWGKAAASVTWDSSVFLDPQHTHPMAGGMPQATHVAPHLVFSGLPQPNLPNRQMQQMYQAGGPMRGMQQPPSSLNTPQPAAAAAGVRNGANYPPAGPLNLYPQHFMKQSMADLQMSLAGLPSTQAPSMQAPPFSPTSNVNGQHLNHTHNHHHQHHHNGAGNNGGSSNGGGGGGGNGNGHMKKPRASAGVAAAISQAGNMPASPLMEEFRKKNRTWELPDFIGYVAEFSRDQDGSRMIQKKLEQGESGQANLQAVFDELYPCALPLMTDVFGNYVIQKLLEYGNDDHRRQLTEAMRGHVVELTLQTYGCRVVQKALDLAPMALRESIVTAELKGNVPQCVMDTNGNHVIQKCIEVIPAQSAFIIRAFQGQVRTLATHPYGCRVIQKILEHAKRDSGSPLAKAMMPVVDEVCTNVRDLVMNQNGNYVVQHVMTNAGLKYTEEIVQNLKDIFPMLACQKFASNVAEKIYLAADMQTREYIIERITSGPPQETSLLTMMRDQYGNYVVQKMLDSRDLCCKLLIPHIKPHAASLQRTNYGKHILSKVDRIESGHYNNGGGRGMNRA